MGAKLHSEEFCETGSLSYFVSGVTFSVRILTFLDCLCLLMRSPPPFEVLYHRRVGGDRRQQGSELHCQDSGGLPATARYS
jgi:hypothetical protein